MMSIEKLIAAGKESVRNSPELLAEYKNLFKEKFGREPVCTGCTFNTDWYRLTGTVSSQNTTEMITPTFSLKKPYEIYSYDIVDKKTKKTTRVRTYGSRMTEEFANNYLTHGTAEEIAERKEQFRVLPAFIEPALEGKTVAELKAIAAEKGYNQEEYSSLKKSELVAYLDAKALEGNTEED